MSESPPRCCGSASTESASKPDDPGWPIRWGFFRLLLHTVRTVLNMRKTFTAIAVAGGLVLGSLAIAAFNPLGFADAQDEEESPAEEERNGRGPGIVQEALDSLVEDGTLTQDQADATSDRIREHAEDSPRRGPMGHLGGGEKLESLAETLGTDVESLGQALRDGQTIAEIAEANGVDPQTVIDSMVADKTERIDQAVADGRIDTEKAEEIKAGLAERITARVNGERPEGFEGRGGFGPGRGFGPGGSGPGGFGERPAD